MTLDLGESSKLIVHSIEEDLGKILVPFTDLPDEFRRNYLIAKWRKLKVKTSK